MTRDLEPSEQRAVDGMIGALQRLQTNSASRQVSLEFSHDARFVVVSTIVPCVVFFCSTWPALAISNPRWVSASPALRANSSQYPLSDRMLKPQYDPHYYIRLRDGVHKAQQGQGRSWWRSFFQLRGEA